MTIKCQTHHNFSCILFLVCIVLVASFMGCSANPRTEESPALQSSPAVLSDISDLSLSVLYYERNPKISFILEGLAVTEETMGQIVGDDEFGKKIRKIMDERMPPLKEIRRDYYEIDLDFCIDESCGYTIWGLFRPYAMYAFNNVLLRSGDKLTLKYTDSNKLCMTVEHPNGETRDYTAVLVFIE